MADKNKSQKLAAAKRKLKEFKSKHKAESSGGLETSSHLAFGANPDVEQNANINQPEETVNAVVAVDQNGDLQASFQSSADISGAEMLDTIPTPPTAIPMAQQIVENNCMEPVIPEQTDANQELHKATERNQELCSQMWLQHAAIEQMKAEIDRLKMEHSAKLSAELEMKDKQLESHLQSFQILVNEKNDLANRLSKEQSVAKSKTEEVEELQARLFASRYRGQVLEKELDVAKNSQERYDDTQQKLCTELENARDEISAKKKELEDCRDEIAELKQKITMKTNEMDGLQTDLHKIRSDLNMSQLRNEQFSAGGQITSNMKIELILDERNQLEIQVKDLQQTIQQINAEREQADQQYQNYVQHLNRESTNLAAQVQNFAQENERLAKRETELTKHMSDLERQIQQQMAKQKSMSEINKTTYEKEGNGVDAKKWSFEVEQLQKDKCTLEQHLEDHKQQIRSISLQLQEQLGIIGDLEATVERVRSEQPDAKNLLEAIESDKVAASRAVAQNQDLKLQLEEIQKAYIQLSNDKLELTDRLQSEQHLGSEIKSKFGEIEGELSTLREKLHYKDEEMIRLSHENEELNKQILQQSQELDRLRHYEAKSQSGDMLHRELLNASDMIGKLRIRIKELENGNKALHNDEVVAEETPNEIKSTNGMDNRTESENSIEVTSNPIYDSSETVSISSTLNIATEQAMDRLQQRFTRTMSEVADLTEEKHRLEHLVMQLQGETETIGEYIALYQNQRRLLKQREVEKDIQLQHIASERESMKQSLVRLNNLVVQLLMQHGVENAKELVQSVQNQNPVNTNDVINHDAVKHTPQLISKNEKDQPTAETATEIIRLLSEIKEKNLNENLMNYTPQIQHCHCCSGKLETV